MNTKADWNEKNYISWKPIIGEGQSACGGAATAGLAPIGGTAAAEPSCSQNNDGTTFLTSSLVPRPTAWIAVYPAADNSTTSEIDGGGNSNYNQPLVALVEGYCGASDRPPTLMLGSDSVPSAILNGLRQNGVCSLSVATERERYNANRMMALRGEKSGPAKTFNGAMLQPCPPPVVLSSLPCPNSKAKKEKGIVGSNYWRRPPAVESSPVHMHCRLILDVPLQTDGDSSPVDAPSMLLLQVDTYVIDGKILVTQSCHYPGQPTIHGNPDVRSITARIDCLLLRPLASLGDGKFGRVGCIYHMRRPMPIPKSIREISLKDEDISYNEESSTSENDLNENTCNNTSWENRSLWDIDQLVAVDSIYCINHGLNGDGETIEYTYRLDSYCPLGYNPMKQVVCPRFIGWISTYEPNSLRNSKCHGVKVDPIHHISPYSFFIDVARGSRPMVAFAACPRSDEFADSDDDEFIGDQFKGGVDDRKDAWRDAEDTGVFCVNLVSQELAWAMSASAAPLGKGLSEFRLMEGGSSYNDDGHQDDHQNPTTMHAPTIDAPYVSQSPMFMECRYVKTGKKLHDYW